MVLAIEREWAKAPGWFQELTPERRALLLADWQIRHKPKDQKPKRTHKTIGRYR